MNPSLLPQLWTFARLVVLQHFASFQTSVVFRFSTLQGNSRAKRDRETTVSGAISTARNNGTRIERTITAPRSFFCGQVSSNGDPGFSFHRVVLTWVDMDTKSYVSSVVRSINRASTSQGGAPRGGAKFLKGSLSETRPPHLTPPNFPDSSLRRRLTKLVIVSRDENCQHQISAGAGISPRVPRELSRARTPPGSDSNFALYVVIFEDIFTTIALHKSMQHLRGVSARTF